MSEPTYRVTLDGIAYDHKPTGGETAQITSRLRAAGPSDVTADQLARAIATGRTWCGGCFEPDAYAKFGSSEFLGLQVYALDFDNDVTIRGADGKPLKDEAGHALKRPIMPDESGYLDPWNALDRFRKSLRAWPLMLYPSMSFAFDGTERGRFDQDTRMKYRLLYGFDTPITDSGRALAAIARVLGLFPEADQKCVNLNRLFFGSCGKAVWYEGESGRPNYVVA